MSELQAIITKDGSSSLYLPSIDETYHSTYGAITESKYVFLAKGLDYIRATQPKRQTIRVLEIGFGTGLNTWLTACAATQGAYKLRMNTLEKYPLPEVLINQLNYTDGCNESEIELFEKIHSSRWGNEIRLSAVFSLVKVKTDCTTYQYHQSAFDLIYFDAFAPSRQAEMWEISQIDKMYAALTTNGVLVSYCAQGQFKRNLKKAGFEVEILRGPLGKREMTRAVKK